MRHVYGRRWQVLADLDGAGRVLRSYTWGGGVDNLLAARVGARVYAALTDAQGTVWGLVGAGGEVAARWTYDAWGNVLSEEAADPALASFRYRFQGRELSAATGLVYFRARWYDPGTGRWLSKDPVRIMGGLNLYEFCLGNPVSDVDPFGLSAGEKARDWARKQKGKTKYNVWGTRGFPRWWGRFKCNLFVADAYNEGNGTELIPTGIWGTHPPSANDWYEGNNIPPGFVKTKDAQVGDVISDGSHVGIVADPGTSSISASSIDNAVIENDWGFRSGQDVSFWHLE